MECCPLEDLPPLGEKVKTADNSSKRSQMQLPFFFFFYEVRSMNSRLSSFDKRIMLLKLLRVPRRMDQMSGAYGKPFENMATSHLETSLMVNIAECNTVDCEALMDTPC